MPDVHYKLIAIEDNKTSVYPNEVILHKLQYTIGRSNQCDIVISDRSVSRFHAELRYDQGYYWLYNYGSTATFINGDAITKELIHKMRDQDLLSFGGRGIALRYIDYQTTEARKLQHDLNNKDFCIGNKRLELSVQQYRLLLYLFEHQGVVCDRMDCVRHVWREGYSEDLAGNPLTLVLHQIQKKIAYIVSDVEYIEIRRGIGIKLNYF